MSFWFFELKVTSLTEIRESPILAFEVKAVMDGGDENAANLSDVRSSAVCRSL